MGELMQFMASAAAGALLGLVFFWGLWVTVNQLGQVRHAGIWMLGSLLLRFGLVLAGFYLLARYGEWEHVLAAAVGFMLSRFFIVRYVRAYQIKGNWMHDH